MSTEPFSPFGVSVVYINDEGVAPKDWGVSYRSVSYKRLYMIIYARR